MSNPKTFREILAELGKSQRIISFKDLIKLSHEAYLEDEAKH
jgi:hypothetical protein